MYCKQTDHLVKAEFLTSADSLRWDECLSSFYDHDTYFTSQYHALSKFDGSGEAFAYIAEYQSHKLFFPFLVTKSTFAPNQQVVTDLQSCYGYGGPLSTTCDTTILSQLWDPFFSWCKEMQILAAFVRCHPLSNTQNYLPAQANKIFNRETVFIDLQLTKECLWNSYPSAQRAKITKAKSQGLKVRLGQEEEIVSIFKPMYEDTMKNLNANGRYFFSDEYFNFLATKMAKKVKLFLVDFEGKSIAGAIFLQGNRFFHYHLGASKKDEQYRRPNNLLFHEAANYALDIGLEKLHLGGGRTTSQDDALLRFKSSFSKLRSPFYIATILFDDEKYQSYYRLTESFAQGKEKPDQLLFYKECK